MNNQLIPPSSDVVDVVAVVEVVVEATVEEVLVTPVYPHSPFILP